ncbi:MAG: hypothetical protein ACE5JG_11160, partial [Planctomycetota bacterium]
KLGQFRGREALGFARRWQEAETDPAVKKALQKAIAQQTVVPPWDATKATGPPDAKPATKDHRNAWASKAANGGREWLELTYATPLRAHRVRIYEVLSAGAVVAVETVDGAGRRRTVWRGDDPTTVPGPFEVTFPLTSYGVKRVRVILDTTRRSGWNEIDAVELVGPDGRAWASGAVASTTFGQ